MVIRAPSKSPSVQENGSVNSSMKASIVVEIFFVGVGSLLSRHEM
jgi:hypothetical protein